MELSVKGPGPATPFLRARDLFETTYDLHHPVDVHVKPDPDERTWAGHYEDHHVLNISAHAARSAMARELALHEYAHMRRYETEHPSHTQSTAEALLLACPGRQVERRKITHAHQIANHMKDIYADDITLRVGPPDKLIAFLESELAGAVADHQPPQHGFLATANPVVTRDPDITAINAAFALALLERHDLVDPSHRIYDLAHAAGRDAPGIDIHAFTCRFRTLEHDPDASTYRKSLVDALRAYVGPPPERAAD